MRVAIFTNNYFPRISGVSIAVGFLNDALNEHGHQTMIIAPDYGTEPEVPGVHVERVTSLALPKLKMALTLEDLDRTKIRYLMRGFRPDIIHCHHPFLLGNSAVEMADELNRPLVYTFHTLYDSFAHYFPISQKMVRQQIKDYMVEFSNHCDLVITPTEPIKDYYYSIGGTTRAVAIPTGIDFARFENVRPEQVQSLRAKFRLDRFDHVLLSVGRIAKEKRVALCVETLGELVRRGDNVGLLFFGEGPAASEIESLARSKGLSDRMIMGGVLDQQTLAAAYSLGSVFLFPSESDTQGIVLYEALAAGLPIVATNTMASRAVVKPDENGLFAEANPKSFADQVQTILADPHRFEFTFDIDAYSTTAIGARYEREYQQTIDQGRRPKIKEPSFLEMLASALGD